MKEKIENFIFNLKKKKKKKKKKINANLLLHWASLTTYQPVWG